LRTERALTQRNVPAKWNVLSLMTCSVDAGMTMSLTKIILAIGVALPLFAQPAQLTTVIDGAKKQVGVTRLYDGRYVRLSYPGGDVPIERGVCTDVIVRAYRHAGVDLQVRVHDDMKRNFAAYPKNWGLRRPDSNIDHRRVPNLQTFFRRKGERLPVTQRGADYKPGDIVTWLLSAGVPHIGIVSDVRVPNTDRYQIVHNVGSGAQIEDVLFAYEITGHYRYR
jgi:uncharacterized protein YijF (DUF1287 family)